MIPETLHALLDRGDDTALVHADDGSARSYSDLATEVDDLAGRLRALGVGRGDRVALIISDGHHFIRCLLAVTTLGAAATPLNPAYTAAEFRFYLDDLTPRLILSLSGQVAAARSAARGRVEVVDVDEQLLGVRPIAYERATSSDIALVLHTSGTTSRPKQVPLLHRNLVASARGLASVYELSPLDVSYCSMPLFHVHGLVASVLAPLASGGSVVVPSRFAAGRFWRQASAYGVTWTSAGPTLHGMMLNRRNGPMSVTFRFVRSCSSALPAELAARIEEAYSAPIIEAYGMTEGSHQLSSNPLPPLERRIGSVGLPSPGVEIRIMDVAGADAEVGEVVIRGPGVTPGYVANPEANTAAFLPGGWFRTGDLGKLDSSGYLWLEGRIKELIIRGGENISPSEIEDALLAHPAVQDAVAFGISDPTYGEIVGAAVSLNGEADQNTLQAWCAERLAAFKVPKTIFLLDKVPRTPTGKLQRKRIGDRLTGAS